MTYINSNLTNREAYALHGELDDARMQALLDMEEAHETLETAKDDIQEKYDYLKQNVFEALSKLESITWGNAKQTVDEVITVLQDE